MKSFVNSQKQKQLLYPSGWIVCFYRSMLWIEKQENIFPFFREDVSEDDFNWQVWDGKLVTCHGVAKWNFAFFLQLQGHSPQKPWNKQRGNENRQQKCQTFVWKTDCVYRLCDSLVGMVPRNQCLILIKTLRFLLIFCYRCTFKKHKYLIISEAPWIKFDLKPWSWSCNVILLLSRIRSVISKRSLSSCFLWNSQ